MFSKAFWRKVAERYERLFAIGEIRNERVLQFYFGATLLFFFLSFSYFINTGAATIEGYQSGYTVCWPHWQECGEWFFLHDLYNDYSKGVFYMLLYGVLALIAWFMWRGKWVAAHALLLIPFLWEALLTFFFTYNIIGPPYYYHLFLTAILLFASHKEYFLRVAFVLFYFLSATIKLDGGWILGTYFTALQTGLPLFPDAMTPLFTNVVILSQIVGCWFLLSRNTYLQRGALIFFAFFHLYSGILVSYMYPTTALIPLLILFGPFNRPKRAPFTRASLVGWAILALVIAFHIIGFLIPGDRRMTMEGKRYGFFMFDANHQCVVETVRYSADDAAAPLERWESASGTQCLGFSCLVGVTEEREGGLRVRTERHESNFSQHSCDPYEWWARLQRVCERQGVERVALRFDHSINGGPFYRIVDTEDICSKEYSLFRKNEWLLEPPAAEAVGYPVKNIYRY